jgi:hypothetical protein
MAAFPVRRVMYNYVRQAGAFLLTWYVLSWLQHKALALFGR